MLTLPDMWPLETTARETDLLPVFWRSPHDVIHATVDTGQMVDWISELEAGENGCLASSTTGMICRVR